MRRMVCEVCHGQDFCRAQDGHDYICVQCGMRYTPAEVLGLTTYVAPKTQDPRESEWIDRAIGALAAKHYYEAETYCAKVVQANGASFVAWCMRAEAVCGQTTLDDDRIAEAIAHFGRAFDVAPDCFRDLVRERSAHAVSQAVTQQVSRICGCFAESDTSEAGERVRDLPRYLEDLAIRLRFATGAELVFVKRG